MDVFERLRSGEVLYGWASDCPEALEALTVCADKCYAINSLPPSHRAEREAILRELLGSAGHGLVVNPPFRCDFGFNIHIGSNFIGNFNLTILDEAEVRIGNNGCFLAANELVYNEDGSYSINFDHLEQLASAPQATLMLICNPFGVAGLIAAYTKGSKWLDDLRTYLWHNYLLAKDFLSNHLPQFTVTPLQGTYLLWLNCTPTGMTSEEIATLLETEGKVMVSPGSIYGPGGDDFIRINLACPRSLLQEGLQRIVGVLSRISK